MNNFSFKFLVVLFLSLGSLHVLAMGEETDFLNELAPHCSNEFVPVSQYLKQAKAAFCKSLFGFGKKNTLPKQEVTAPVEGTKIESPSSAVEIKPTESVPVIPEVAVQESQSAVTKPSVIAKTLKFITSPVFLASAVIGSTVFFAYKKGYLARIYKKMYLSIAEKIAERKARQIELAQCQE